MTESSGQADTEDDSKSKGSTSWTELPETYGNYAGKQIEGTLGVVGKPVGQGLSRTVAPVGNVVGAIVNPVMTLGDSMNSAPDWGPDVETSARNGLSNLVDQGKQTLSEHHGGEANKIEGDSGKNDTNV